MGSGLHDVLNTIDRNTADGTASLVVFDLDSTLFSTSDRHVRILREFAACHEAVDGLVDAVANIRPVDLRWSADEPLRAAGFDDPALLKALRSFWGKRFFTDEYVQCDTPVHGAVEYARQVHARGALVYYLTGRDVHGMGAGTSKSLTQWGFPLWRGRTVLHLKPRFDMDDKEYKAEALNDIRSHQTEVVATFENEPGNANLFLEAFPEGAHFLLNTTHSPNAEPPHADLVQIPHFGLS